LGYPDAEHEVDVLRPGSTAGDVAAVPAVTDTDEVTRIAASLRRLHVADPLLRYVRRLGAATREDPRTRLGASTRGLRGLVSAVQVHAAAQGRHYVVPADVQYLLVPVLEH